MTTGVLVIARLGSTRLVDKHLIKVGGKTYIEWLVCRFAAEFLKEIEAKDVSIIIATSTKKENQKFETVFKSSEVRIFYGADDNIPLRQLECAEKFNLTNIISIDGDDILCSVKGAREVLKLLGTGTLAVKTTGLPLGMNSMGYKVSYLKECLSKREPNAKFETGWGRIFDSAMIDLEIETIQKDERLRFTLDYEQDAVFFSNIITYFGTKIVDVSDNDIVEYVLGNKIFKTNASLNKTYWDNFNNLKQAEL